MKAPPLIALALAALVPAPAQGDPLALGAGAAPGGALLGRVCLDLDGDGVCGPGEPGVAGARVLSAAGQVALADGAGRFHFLEVPARVLAGDRLAYGGQRVKVEGLAAARLVDLAPEGAAQVDLAVPVSPARPPALEAAGVPGTPPRREGDRLRWPLGGRTSPGARVSAAGASATAAADGTFALELLLSPGDNAFGVTVAAEDGEAALYRWPVHLAPRARGGDLVIPERPALLAAFAVKAAAGGALVHGTASPGTRVRVGGVAATPGPAGVFAAWARAEGGKLEVVLDDGRGAPVVFAVAAGDGGGRITVAALAEVEVAFGGDPGVLVSGRGTGAVRGTLGPATLEAGVDLDDRDRELSDLARPRDGLAAEHALVPERTFLATGDEGASGDRNPARGRVWARLEAPDLRVDLGSARTGLVGGELGRNDRPLFGAVASAGRDLGPVRLEASAFGASLRTDARGNAPPQGARDTFVAHRGASYWLSHAEVVPGSEVVRVQWRDPFTGLTTAQRNLVRGEDYEVDWASGRLVLARPLPMVVAPTEAETGAPSLGAGIAVLVDYQHAAVGPAGEDLHGGRAGLRAGPLALEARGAREERPGGGEGYGLASAAATLDLGFLALRAETAASEGRPGGTTLLRSRDGGYTFAAAGGLPRDGEALHLQAQGGYGPARLSAWWRDRSAGYSDGTFEEAAHVREQGASLELERGSLTGGATWSERSGTPIAAPAGAAPEDSRRLVGRGRWRGESLELLAEVVDEERTEPARAEELSAGVRVTWQADPRLALDLSHHQGLRTSGAGVDQTFTAAGATVDVGGSKLGVRGGWGPDLGPRIVASGERASAGEAVYGTFTADPDAPSVTTAASLSQGLGRGSAAALGARRRAGGTEIFSEEQVGRDAFGLRAGRVVGMALEPLRGLRLAVSGERGVRLAPDGTEVNRTAASGSAGLVAGRLRLAARGELRREGVGRADAAGGSIEWRLAEPLTLSARASWVDGDLSGVRAHLLELSAGGALRLARGALLATMTRLQERRPGAAEREGVLGRMAATAQLGGRLSLGAGAGLAVQRVAGGRDDRLSGSVRASLRVLGPVDLGAEAARRGPLGQDHDVGVRSALRAEVGVSLPAGRLALGYHLVGFTGDGLSPEDEVGRLFHRAQLVY